MKIKFYRNVRDKLKDKKNELMLKLLDRKKAFIEKIDLTNIKRILFMRIDGKIGDYIVGSFVYREIKKKYPHIIIDIVGDVSLENIFKLNKNIDNYYLFKRKNFFDMLRVLKILKNNNYDILIDSSDGMKYKHMFFIRMVNASINIGYNKKKYGLYNQNIECYNNKMSEIYEKILQKMGLTNINKTYDIPFSEKSEKNISLFFKEKKIDNSEKIIALNFFGYGKRRKINDKNALIIIKFLQKMYINSKIIILDSPKDKKMLTKILKYRDDKNILFYDNSKTILDSISIIKRCNLVVSPDTSILHIAEGLKKEIIAFYRDDEENMKKWGITVDKKHKIIVYEQDINEFDYKKSILEK